MSKKGVVNVICIGSVSIENVSGSANVQFGNIVNRAPITSEKTTKVQALKMKEC